MWAFHRMTRKLYKLVTYTGILETEVGHQLFNWAYIRYKEILESPALLHLSAVILPNSTVVDVGANIGIFTTRFAGWVGPKGMVIAVEPETKNIKDLQDRVRRSGYAERIHIVEGVAADKNGKFRLALDSLSPASHFVSDTGVEVNGWTIDHMLEQQLGAAPVSLIKVDAEGAEERVLKGAEQTLARDKPALFVEINPQQIARGGTNALQFLASFERRGYALHIISKREGLSTRRTPEEVLKQTERRGYLDVLFMPTHRKQE